MIWSVICFCGLYLPSMRCGPGISCCQVDCVIVSFDGLAFCLVSSLETSGRAFPKSRNAQKCPQTASSKRWEVEIWGVVHETKLKQWDCNKKAFRNLLGPSSWPLDCMASWSWAWVAGKAFSLSKLWWRQYMGPPTNLLRPSSWPLDCMASWSWAWVAGKAFSLSRLWWRLWMGPPTESNRTRFVWVAGL